MKYTGFYDNDKWRTIGIGISFCENILEIIEYQEKETLEFQYPLRFIEDHNICYVEWGEGFENKWLYLHAEGFILLFEDEGKYKFLGNARIGKISEWDIAFNKSFYSATSCFSEEINDQIIFYNAENLGLRVLEHPWVEGITGDGIGEKIITTDILRKPEKYIPTTGATLYISNGFVSYDKPYLYTMNSRVKRFLLHDIRTGYEQELDLEDTPHFQRFVLPLGIGADGIELEIKEVYPGTDFEDTCVNMIGITYNRYAEDK